jgi:hypothetical protein
MKETHFFHTVVSHESSSKIFVMATRLLRRVVLHACADSALAARMCIGPLLLLIAKETDARNSDRLAECLCLALLAEYRSAHGDLHFVERVLYLLTMFLFETQSVLTARTAAGNISKILSGLSRHLENVSEWKSITRMNVGGNVAKVEKEKDMEGSKKLKSSKSNLSQVMLKTLKPVNLKENDHTQLVERGKSSSFHSRTSLGDMKSSGYESFESRKSINELDDLDFENGENNLKNKKLKKRRKKSQTLWQTTEQANFCILEEESDDGDEKILGSCYKDDDDFTVGEITDGSDDGNESWSCSLSSVESSSELTSECSSSVDDYLFKSPPKKKKKKKNTYS